jgi:hypothetical protein
MVAMFVEITGRDGKLRHLSVPLSFNGKRYRCVTHALRDKP